MTSSSASCKLDPIPTWLLKRCSSDISPVITKMINLSFQDCHFHGSWKIAHVNPLLKRSGLDAEFANFRPVSNLSFVYKTTERKQLLIMMMITDNQLFTHCESFALLPTNQSAYRKFHSTETALLRVQSDILMSMDRQEVTLLILLDLSAAFDTIDHTILLDILDNDFGIIGNAKEWIKSFLCKRQQHVLVEDEISKPKQLDCGVPQGSCLGPVLFLLYASGLFQVVNKHLPTTHAYADDSQIYLSFRPHSSASQDLAVSAIESCVADHDVRAWLVLHRFMFNDTKTELLIIGSKHQLSKVSIDSIKVDDSHSQIKPSDAVRNLGSWFDSHMNMNVQVGKICSKVFYGLYNIRQIRKFLSPESTKILVHAFVTCHLDYCNSLLHGISQCQINRLQKVLNSAARIITLTSKFHHIIAGFAPTPLAAPLILVFNLKSPFLSINPLMEPHLPTSKIFYSHKVSPNAT